MGYANRAGLAGIDTNWAEDHVEGDFGAAPAFTRALDQATNFADMEAADEELFEDDLISLITLRPSRHGRTPKHA